jgi:hypothetical protein
VRSKLGARTTLLSLAAAILTSSCLLGACVSTPGAPEDDAYDAENPAQVIEEEADEEDWEDANR